MEKSNTPAGKKVQQAKQENSNINRAASSTDPQKVKQEIKEDLNNGIGDMTAREAGAMRD
ncbi:hypothetical protein ACFQ2J_10410 [Thalassobacillus hwangdonensis]|uniref:Small, acid-soluble spore protein gamma-type n=2 Tax=Thalassobacillus hwangdonensis TaxID=546108 RepID=A0ABW3L4T2_9BACI